MTLTDDQKQLIGVKTSEVVERETSSQIRTSGRICYDETAWVDVNLKVSGWIQDLYVDHVGRPVRKGEALFTLYSPDLVSGQEEYLLAFRGKAKASEGPEWNARLLASARERLQLWDRTNRSATNGRDGFLVCRRHRGRAIGRCWYARDTRQETLSDRQAGYDVGESGRV